MSPLNLYIIDYEILSLLPGNLREKLEGEAASSEILYINYAGEKNLRSLSYNKSDFSYYKSTASFPDQLASLYQLETINHIYLFTTYTLIFHLLPLALNFNFKISMHQVIHNSKPQLPNDSLTSSVSLLFEIHAADYINEIKTKISPTTWMELKLNKNEFTADQPDAQNATCDYVFVGKNHPKSIQTITVYDSPDVVVYTQEIQDNGIFHPFSINPTQDYSLFMYLPALQSECSFLIKRKHWDNYKSHFGASDFNPNWLIYKNAWSVQTIPTKVLGQLNHKKFPLEFESKEHQYFELSRQFFLANLKLVKQKVYV